MFSGDNQVFIDLLPDEILDHIFGFLDVQPRVKTEQVCKRWLWLGRVYHWQKLESLIFDPTKPNKTAMRGKWVLTDKLLLQILMRCGPAMRKISLVKSTLFNYQYKICVTAKSVRIISEYCRNVTEIELIGIPLSKTILKTLAKGCSKLRIVKLSDYDEKCYDDLRLTRWCSSEGQQVTSETKRSDTKDFVKYHLKQDELSAFLKRCKTLESLTLRLDHFGLKRHFNFNSKKLKVLRFRHLAPNFFKRIFHIELFVTCDHLTELRLANCFVPPELLSCILQRFRNTLQVLDLRDFCRPHLQVLQNPSTRAESINWCETLRILEKLEELRLFVSGVEYEYPCHHVNNEGECFGVVSKHLRVLDVTHSGFNDASNVRFLTKLLEGCSNIQELNLYSFTLTPGILKLCRKFENTLKILSISECRITGERRSWLHDICAVTKNVQVCYFRELDRLTDHVLKTMFSATTTNLRTLNIMGTSVTDVGVSHLATLPFLVVLSVTGCFYVTDEGVRHLAVQGRLEELYAQPGSVESVNNITDKGCKSLANFCPNFRVLDVTCREYVTNRLVAVFCDSLERGFLRNNVSLFVDFTSVTANHRRHSSLDVMRNSNSYNYDALTVLKTHR